MGTGVDLTVIFILILSAVGHADVDSITDLTAIARADSVSGNQYLEVSIPSSLTTDSGNILFAEVVFKAKLPVGTEIELWPVTSTVGLPWEAEAQSSERRVWVVDERTGSAVRFDVTDLTRAAVESGKAASFLLRLSPADASENPALELPSSVGLTLHRDP